MKDDIMFFIRETGGNVSFAELCEVEGFMGEYRYSMPGYPTVVLWDAMSTKAIVALSELVKQGFLDIKQATPVVYMIDGVVLRLPLAKSIRAYKKHRWLPVTFSLTQKPYEVTK